MLTDSTPTGAYTSVVLLVLPHLYVRLMTAHLTPDLSAFFELVVVAGAHRMQPVATCCAFGEWFESWLAGVLPPLRLRLRKDCLNVSFSPEP